MFEIVSAGERNNRPRLLARACLTRADFDEIAATLEAKPFRARKIGLVAAREARNRQLVETQWNGTETTNLAELGDFIVTSLSPTASVLIDGNGQPNTYVVTREQFLELYGPIPGKNEFGQYHRSRNVVDALPLAGGFDIEAPWGERQVADAGFLIRNGAEVYGNHRDTFEATYRSEQ